MRGRRTRDCDGLGTYALVALGLSNYSPREGRFVLSTNKVKMRRESNELHEIIDEGLEDYGVYSNTFRPRPPDWTCRHCGTDNPYWRGKCYKCVEVNDGGSS